VLLAHKLALANENIRADMVETTEFPYLGSRYRVYGVPRTVINDVIQIEGAVPEDTLVERLMAVLDQSLMDRLRQEWNRQRETG
jgi:predicted DsbA family dithiol-disulfide isomerase